MRWKEKEERDYQRVGSRQAVKRAQNKARKEDEIRRFVKRAVMKGQS
jgi:hypothetical protein